MKKMVFTFVTVLVFIVLSMTVAYADGSVIKVNTEFGTVTVNYTATDYSDLKVLVTKGSERYIYNLYDSSETFPLQMGDGQYTIGIYQRTSGNKYRKITSSTASVKVDTNKVFLASVQNVNWSREARAIMLTEEMTSKTTTDREKFETIHDFVVKNIVYDYKKASTVGNRYIPAIDNTIDEEKGICYDYASLVASMLRSLDIPTKLVEGQSTYTSAYHAWNEVLLDGKWVIIDMTADAQFDVRGIKYSVEKSDKNYSVTRSF